MKRNEWIRTDNLNKTKTHRVKPKPSRTRQNNNSHSSNYEWNHSNKYSNVCLAHLTTYFWVLSLYLSFHPSHSHSAFSNHMNRHRGCYRHIVWACSHISHKPKTEFNALHAENAQREKDIDSWKLIQAIQYFPWTSLLSSFLVSSFLFFFCFFLPMIVLISLCFIYANAW